MEQKPDSFTYTDHGVTVTLDTRLTPALIDEGFVRELISKIQTMRKDAGFNVTDHIAVTVSGSDKINTIVTENAAAIAGDVLAESVAVGEPDGFVKTWDLNGENAGIGVKVVG